MRPLILGNPHFSNRHQQAGDYRISYQRFFCADGGLEHELWDDPKVADTTGSNVALSRNPVTDS